MHSYLIKIMVVLGALAMIFVNAGIPPSIMHAATISSSNDMETIAINSVINSLSNPNEVFSAQQSMFAVDYHGTSVKVLSPAQPLGSLAAITWNNWDISEDQPVSSNLMIFPNAENTPCIISTADNYTFQIETNRLKNLFNNISHEKETVYCLACHSSPNIGVLTKITHLNGRLIDQQGDPASILECGACHKQLSQQTLWHLRGVE